ncbi:hypothetical protein QVD17_23644 [Tagetes erecta]|uniref:Uncharacterized protein n=1 Tax=Tagetes erecta TaxID=13708 RepID=A0AAD8NUE1_TARER|nr:hypothetical protein QVD17_23644 [Tagetes erecta]
MNCSRFLLRSNSTASTSHFHKTNLHLDCVTKPSFTAKILSTFHSCWIILWQFVAGKGVEPLLLGAAELNFCITSINTSFLNSLLLLLGAATILEIFEKGIYGHLLFISSAIKVGLYSRGKNTSNLKWKWMMRHVMHVSEGRLKQLSSCIAPPPVLLTLSNVYTHPSFFHYKCYVLRFAEEEEEAAHS